MKLAPKSIESRPSNRNVGNGRVDSVTATQFRCPGLEFGFAIDVFFASVLSYCSKLTTFTALNLIFLKLKDCLIENCDGLVTVVSNHDLFVVFQTQPALITVLFLKTRQLPGNHNALFHLLHLCI